MIVFTALNNSIKGSDNPYMVIALSVILVIQIVGLIWAMKK